jgi:hypothetical protein
MLQAFRQRHRRVDGWSYYYYGMSSLRPARFSAVFLYN